MPADVTQAKNFLLTSDYPVDKITYMHEETITVGAGSYNDVTINHSLGFAPLLQSQWTYDSSWSYGYDQNAGPVLPSGLFEIQTSVESTSSTITIRNTNNTASSKTVYWRIYGFEPSNSNTDISYTSSNADNYILNTDYNYAKLYLEGVTASSSTLGSTEVIAHNLGYKPQVLSWVEDTSGTVYWMNSYTTRQSSNNSVCTVDTSNVTFTRDTGILSSAVKFHYRIYLEDQS